MTLLEALRWVTIVCSSLAVLIGTPQWGRWWRTLPPGIVQGRLALAAYNLAGLYGTCESLARGIPPGPRSAVVTLAALWCLYAVAWDPIERLLARNRQETDRAEPDRRR